MIEHYWVLSTGRCATVTLTRLFQLCPTANSYHEVAPRLFGIGRDAYKYYNNNKETDKIRKKFLEKRRALFKKAEAEEKKYIEVGPHVTFLPYIINSIFPDSKFIHLIRNPEDVIISGLNRDAYINDSSDKLRIRPRLESEHFKDWEKYTQLQKLSWFWMTTNQWISDFMRTLPNERKLLIHSEDIFENNKDVINNIFKFVGLPKPNKVDINNILNKKLNATTNKKVKILTDDEFKIMKSFVNSIANNLEEMYNGNRRC